MSTTSEGLSTSPERPNGLATYLKVLYAPGEAFTALSRVPTWGWAAILGIVLTLVGTIILTPATTHFAHVMQERQLAQMPADQAAIARQRIASLPQWVIPMSGIVGAVIVIWLVWLIGAVIYVVGAAVTGGEARFAGAWAIAVNIYIIGAVGSIVNAIIVVMRGADNVNAQSDLYGLPSLATLVSGPPKLAMFLYGFNIFNVWLYIVAVIALERVMKMSRGAAIATVVVLALLGAGIGALFAK
jgi:hypothetical protein